MKKFFTIVVSVIICEFAIPVWANDGAIIHQQKIIDELKTLSSIPVIFPGKTPPRTDNFYMSYASDAIHPDFNQYWRLNVDATPDCHGIHVCNIGFISAEKNAKINLHYHSLPDNKDHLKERVKLKNNINAYFTPFHIQASGVNPTLEWSVSHVLYTLSWRIPSADPAEQKKILVEMANSATSEDRY